MSQIQPWEAPTNVDDQILDTHLFRLEAILNQLVEIIVFIIVVQALTKYTLAQHKQLVNCSVDY
jgi:hypothetical protein